jgi:EAL domain-containing protein (putative c-di-GMP-specific phosphodiesterase class I)
VAEGIEDEATAECLRALGCDLGQGYFLGRPMDAPELLAWIASREAATQLIRNRGKDSVASSTDRG